MHTVTLAEFAGTFTQLDFDLLAECSEAEFNEVFENLALLSTPLQERAHRRRLAGRSETTQFELQPEFPSQQEVAA